MREFTKKDLNLLIEDSIRMDIPVYGGLWKKGDFAKASFRRYACNDIERYIYSRMGASPRASGEFIIETILEYSDKAKTYELISGSNSIIFKIQYEVAMEIYDIISHLD